MKGAGVWAYEGYSIDYIWRARHCQLLLVLIKYIEVLNIKNALTNGSNE